MKTYNQKNIIIGAFMVVVIILVWSAYKKSQKAKELAAIKDAIDTGKGVNQFDIDSTLSRVIPDTSFTQAKMEALRLQDAKGWLRDDDATVFDVLKNKTKSQLKQISNELIIIEGLTLGQFVNDIFSGFSDGGKIQKAFYIVKNAR